MALTRRSFIKVAGVAAGALLVSLGLQNATVQNIKAEQIPGAGHKDTDSSNNEIKWYNRRLDNIDTAAFLAGCSRCGICIQKCPFNAIKSASIAVPQLTKVSQAKCPGYENCGICATVCPTDCLNDAFRNFRDKYNKDPAAGDKPHWVNGPYEKSERITPK